MAAGRVRRGFCAENIKTNGGMEKNTQWCTYMHPNIRVTRIRAYKYICTHTRKGGEQEERNYTSMAVQSAFGFLAIKM